MSRIVAIIFTMLTIASAYAQDVEQLAKADHSFCGVGRQRRTSDLSKGKSYTAGAEWTVRYIGQNGREFAGKKLRFEVNQEVGDKIRRVDMVVEDDILGNIFYEFKSVKDVPPANFLEQFGKDLLNGEVKDLSQLKWVFDGKKVTQEQLIGILSKTIKDWDIPTKIKDKWIKGNMTEDVFKNKLIDIFKAE